MEPPLCCATATFSGVGFHAGRSCARRASGNVPTILSGSLRCVGRVRTLLGTPGKTYPDGQSHQAEVRMLLW